MIITLIITKRKVKYTGKREPKLIFFLFHHIYSNKECLGACVSKHIHPYRESYCFSAK